MEGVVLSAAVPGPPMYKQNANNKGLSLLAIHLLSQLQFLFEPVDLLPSVVLSAVLESSHVEHDEL